MEGGITGKGFKKGDPRINRRGRPKSFDALRKLAQSLAVEPAKDAHGQNIIIDGHVATNVEMIMREWLREKQKEFVEVAFGKVPMPVEVSGPDKKPVEIKAVNAVDYRTILAAVAPEAGPVADSPAPSQDESAGDGQALGQVNAGDEH